MRLKYVFIFTLLFLSKPLFSQDSIVPKKIKVATLIDTMFIDRNINNWSIRLFTNYKLNKFRIGNSDQHLVYTPANLRRYGIGVATRKFVMDIAFNLNQKGEESTKRLDLMVTTMLKNNQIDFFFQRYQGYNTNNGMTEIFHPDITTFSSGIRYLYMFNGDEYSMVGMKSGLATPKKTVYTWGLGGFLFFNQIQGDGSTLTPEIETFSNEEARIKNLFGFGAGVLANFSATVPLLPNFFATVSITPGIGLMWKRVESESVSYRPENLLLYQVDFRGILGYHLGRFYINWSAGYGLNETSLDFGQRILLSRANLKLALGYKLRKKQTK